MCLLDVGYRKERKEGAELCSLSFSRRHLIATSWNYLIMSFTCRHCVIRTAAHVIGSLDLGNGLSLLTPRKTSIATCRPDLSVHGFFPIEQK